MVGKIAINWSVGDGGSCRVADLTLTVNGTACFWGLAEAGAAGSGVG